MERSHVFIRISICFLDHLTNARFGRRCSGSSLTHKNARRAQSLVCRIIRSSRATLYGYLDNGPAFHLQRIIVNEHRHVGPNGVSRHICDPLNHQVGRGNANHSAIISNSYIDGTAAGIGKGNDILPDTFWKIQLQFDRFTFQEAGRRFFALSHPLRPLSYHVASHVLIILVILVK